MKRRILWILLLAYHCSVAQTGSTQAGSDNIIEASRIQIMSPQVADMVRYDQTEISQNTGRLDLQIPVIAWSDPDFDFPIGISYNSEGFKPATDDNFVGRNWSLTCGGIIYREVKGLPDDHQGERYLGVNISGFLKTAKSGAYNNETLKGQLMNTPADCVTSETGFQTLRANKSHEVSSDIYRFTFGKYSGKFMINFDGTVSVVSNSGGKFRVDISKYRLREVNQPFDSEISITTDDGYVYTFGGSFGAVEYMALSWPDQAHITSDVEDSYMKRHKVVAFGLARITAPNGRMLKIHYMDKMPLQYHNSPGNLLWDLPQPLFDRKYHHNYTLSVSPYQHMAFWREVHPSIPGYFLPVAEGPKSGITYALNKNMLIESIDTDDKYLRFYYSDRGVYPQGEYVDATKFGARCGARLDSVVLSNNDMRILDRTRFTYLNSGRMMLASLENIKMGKYAFDYNSVPANSGPGTINIDHWGYWRGTPANKKLIPEVYGGLLSQDHTMKFSDDNRSSNGSAFDVTLLREIVYPTGGKLKIEYEPHMYSSQIVQNWASNYMPSVEEFAHDVLCGGARVHSLRYYTAEGVETLPVKQVVYQYKNIDTDRGSGMLMYMPRYYHLSRTSVVSEDKGTTLTIILFNESGFNRKDYASDHVRYSAVTEVDVLKDTVRPDSCYTYSLAAPETFSKPQTIEVSVGKLGQVVPGGDELEKVFAKWTFSGGSYKMGQSQVHVTIRKNSFSPVLKEFSFTKGVEPDIVFNPTTELGPGNYIITFEKDKDAYVSFKADYPRSGYRIDSTAGYKVTRYTDYRTNPDYYNCILRFYTNPYIFPDCYVHENTYDEMFLRNFFLEPEDYSIERGKVLSETYYDKDKKIVRRESNRYARVGVNRYGVYISTPVPIGNAALELYSNPLKVWFYNYNTVEKRTVDYVSPADSIVATQELTYDDDGYLLSRRKSVADGSYVGEDYTYAFSCPGDIYDMMRFYNMLSPIVSKERMYGDKQDGRTLQSRITYDYKSTACLNDRTGTFPVLKSATDEFTVDTPRIEYNEYDLYGNPLHIIQDGTLHTVYLWSYLGKYPVARIENATFEEVTAVLGISPTELSRLAYPEMSLVDALRAALTKAHVWTYGYIPGVGLVTATDPSGKKVCYDYDKSGRMIRNYSQSPAGIKEILQYNRYHLINE